MDITNLIIQLQAKVNDLTYNQLAVAKSIELLKTGQVNYVDDISELPTASTVNGYMYYVRGLGIYYSNGTSWTTIETFNYIIENTAWGWGNGLFGSIGVNSTTVRDFPAAVCGGFTNWCQVSGGCYHSLGVRQNGTAWAWGCNAQGQLGDNTVTSRLSPVQVVGGFTDWCQISAGGGFSLAVRTNGTAWAWGCNGSGSLGDNTTTSRRSPVSVVGGFCDWCQVSAGGSHSLAVRQNGTAWAWGVGQYGRLGDGTIADKSSPVSVSGGFTDWCQISAGCAHSLGVRQDGTARAWGCGQGGRLGNNLTGNQSTTVLVVGGFTNWCQVSAGGCHSLGVRQNGTAWAWGVSANGTLGDNSTVSRLSPVSVVGGFTDWCQISAGSRVSVAVRQNGTAWSWGCGTQGGLGDNTAVNKSSPVSVFSPYNDWCQVSAGHIHALAIRNFVDS